MSSTTTPHRTSPLTDFGPLQSPERLGLAPWQFEAAQRHGLIPPPDVASGRWSATLLDTVAARLEEIREVVGEHPPSGLHDHAEAASWAAEALADPRIVVLDTETTGLLDGPDPAYMVEISVLAGDDTVLLDTLINPRVPIPAAATAIHGITDAMVAASPTFSDLLPELNGVLGGRRTVIYNTAFDTGILRRELERHYRASGPTTMTKPGRTHPAADRWMSTLHTECAMEWYAQWFGDWHDYWQSYTWQPLCGGHRARGDCEATLARLRSMAASPQPAART